MVVLQCAPSVPKANQAFERQHLSKPFGVAADPKLSWPGDVVRWWKHAMVSTLALFELVRGGQQGA